MIKINGKQFKELNNKDYGVYKITVLGADNKEYVYIGSGRLSNISDKLSKLRRDKMDNEIMQSAYNKSNNATGELIVSCEDVYECRRLEKEFQDMYIEIAKYNDNIVTCYKNNPLHSATTNEYTKYEKLTADKVAEIKYLYDAINVTNKELAEKYNCSTNTINLIVNNHRWQNVEPLEF